MREILRQGLKRLIANEPTRYAKGRRQATILALSSQKGGVGKTTTAVCLGAALARFNGFATLILDMDAQGHVEQSLRKHTVGAGRPLSEVLLANDRADVLDTVVDTDLESLHITGADPRLGEAEGLMATKIGKEFLLRDALRFTRTHYDFIIIDCPPNLGNLTLNALVAADYVLAPCDASPLAIQGVRDLVGTMTTINERLNRSLDFLGVVLTRIDGRNTTVNEAVVDSLREEYGDLLLNAIVGVNTSLSKAQFNGASIFDFDGRCRAAKQYRALADVVLETVSGSYQNQFAHPRTHFC